MVMPTNAVLPILDVTVVVANWKTLDLIEQCITSLFQHYPDIALVVVDNGSDDDSTAYIQSLKKENVLPILNTRNRGHGPALEQAIDAVETTYVLTLDSDTIVEQGGFLELMVAAMTLGDYYAAGKQHWGNYWGHPPEPGEHIIPMIHPSAALIEIERYRQLTPAIHCGAPLLRNFAEAQARGWRLLDWPIGNYVHHLCRGTRARHGVSRYDRSRPLGDLGYTIT